jgi:hypothetical protein
MGSHGDLFGCPAYAGVKIMSTTPDVIRPVLMGQRPIIVGQQVRDMLGQLHDLYGRDQPLCQHLAGLNARLTQARLLYGPNRSLQTVVSGLYEKLDELRRLYGYDSIEEILDLTIDLKKRLDRMAELQGKVALSAHELREYQVLRQQFKQYLADLARQKAQSHDTRGKNGISKNGLRL